MSSPNDIHSSWCYFSARFKTYLKGNQGLKSEILTSGVTSSSSVEVGVENRVFAGAGGNAQEVKAEPKGSVRRQPVKAACEQIGVTTTKETKTQLAYS